MHGNIFDISLNEKVCHSIEKKGVEEKARTFTDIVQDFKFSKGTHVDLRSQSDPPEGSELRHLSGRIFLRTPTEVSGTSSSGANTETIPVVGPPVASSDTKTDESMPFTSDTPETRPVTETDEMRMETDDHATEISVSEPPLAAPPVPPPQLTRHRICGKRGTSNGGSRRR